MARITPNDFAGLTKLTEAAHSKSAAYYAVKSKLIIPNPNDDSLTAAKQAKVALEEIFIINKFNLIDAIVAERGFGPVTDSDTHFRGRALESVLNGSFNGLAEPDFKYGDLKLIETVRDNVLAQVLTIGAIFSAIDKSTGDYLIEHDYYKSKFYNKVKQAVIISYRKVSKQLGVNVEQVIVFEVDNPLWAKQLKEDWESIKDEMVLSIDEFKAGKRSRRASGICRSDTSGKRRPHGYLGIRSDGVVFTKQFFELMSKHYKEVDSK